MKITYIGHHADGRVILVGEQRVRAPKGQPVEVPDAIAADLLQSPHLWAAADEPKPAGKPAAKKAEG
jgi:hypothetical protein